MNVCLIHPPQPNSLDDRLDVPLGLLYIAAVLRKSGFETTMVDLSSYPEADWQQLIPGADIYGIMVYTCAYYIARRIRDLCKEINPRAPVAVGGAHPTALPVATSADFDYVVTGEGEYAFRELVRDLERGVTVRPISGGYSVEDLDSLPLPARELVDLASYHRRVGEGLATSLITSRGCPFQCAFCGSKTMFGHTRYRSVERVIDEVKMLKGDGFAHFIFYDDTFVMNRERLYPLLDELKKLDITFRCNGRASVNTPEDFERLKDAGCHTVAFGVESGSQKILTRIKKHATVRQNLAAVINAKKAGLHTKLYLVVGLPGETRETIEETKRFIEKADPGSYTLFTFVPLPGCDIWNNPRDYGVTILHRDWGQYYVIAGQNEGGITLRTDTFTPGELVEMRNDLLRFLKSRKWSGTVEDYEKLVTWRKLQE